MAKPGPPTKADDGTWVECRGLVVRLLGDESGPDERHQRFILDIGGRHTLLVAHNLDLAPRVPLGIGDRVAVRGLYEWTGEGGSLHWTHDDPFRAEPGGYVRFRGKDYR